jgi:hypothetical protein
MTATGDVVMPQAAFAPAAFLAAASLATGATGPAALLPVAGGTRLVMAWTDATPAAACFERPSGAMVIAREGDVVEAGNGVLRDFTTHGVDVVDPRLERRGRPAARAHWPIAGVVPSGTLERCQRAFAARRRDVAPAKMHVLLPPPRPDVAPAAMIASATQPPSGWREVAPMTVDEDLLCANNAREWWGLDARDGGIAVTRFREVDTRVLARADGELVGFDHGEFGGRIEWVGRDGARDVVDGDANPVAMIEHDGAVLVATGLNHMGLDRGDLRRLHRGADGRWRSTRWLDLGAAPLATYRVDARTWRIVTSRGVVDVDLVTGTRHVRHANPHWAMLYPTSILPFGDAWFIGARHAVIRLAPGPAGLEERWWVASDCASAD